MLDKHDSVTIRGEKYIVKAVWVESDQFWKLISMTRLSDYQIIFQARS